MVPHRLCVPHHWLGVSRRHVSVCIYVRAQCTSAKLKGLKKEVGTNKILNMSPEAFNGIEVGTVCRQPNRNRTIFEESNRSLRNGAMVIRCIIKDEEDGFVTFDLCHEVFKEVTK